LVGALQQDLDDALAHVDEINEQAAFDINEVEEEVLRLQKEKQETSETV